MEQAAGKYLVLLLYIPNIHGILNGGNGMWGGGGGVGWVIPSVHPSDSINKLNWFFFYVSSDGRRSHAVSYFFFLNRDASE